MTKKGAQKAAEKPPPESEPSNPGQIFLVNRSELPEASIPDGDGLTGIFETDFPLLCVQEEMHAVDVVVLSPKGASVDEAEPKITENVDFFRPKVLVELEDESVRGSVATIHIRGKSTRYGLIPKAPNSFLRLESRRESSECFDTRLSSMFHSYDNKVVQ